jgi:hypothetical protein
MSESLPRFRLNAPGDFFVEDGMCIACTVPEHEAPELMAHAEGRDLIYHCYFRRQPETPEEVEHAIRAVCVSCCGAVQYGGSDPSILDRVKEFRTRGWSQREA